MVHDVARLSKNLNSASLARRSVEAVVAASGMGADEIDALLLIASELVTNATIHGDEPVMLSVSCADSEITVEVADGNPRVESVGIRPDDEAATGGRGLRIVAGLADQWGTRRSHTGKTVWATKAVTTDPTRAR